MKLIRRSFLTRTPEKGRIIESYLLAIDETTGKVLFDLTNLEVASSLRKELINDTISYFDRYTNTGREVIC